MIIIKSVPANNGAYANQVVSNLDYIPDGWLIVPPVLEEAAQQYMPFLALAIENGEIVAIGDNVEARAAQEAVMISEADTEQTPQEQIVALQLALAELGAAQEANQIDSELALAELAGIITAQEGV